MKQCPNCGDTALEEYDKGQGICGWEVFENEDIVFNEMKTCDVIDEIKKS